MTADLRLEIEGLRKAFDDFAFAVRYGIVDGNPRVAEGVSRIEARMERVEALAVGEAQELPLAVFLGPGRGAAADVLVLR